MRGEIAMFEDSYSHIQTLLASTQPDDLREGLALVEEEIARLDSVEARPLFEMVAALFYIDPLDHPELIYILNEAVSLVGGFGDWVIAALLEHLGDGDLKAQLAIGHALGRMGADAIEPLLAAYAASPDPGRRTFILYALGKIKAPKIARAAPVMLEAVHAADREVRDTATRALGTMIESMPPDSLPEDVRRASISHLQANLADASPSIRAKAIRSLGKLARHGYLTAGEQEQLVGSCHRLLGTDEQFEWDRAYIVRKEAAETLRYCADGCGPTTA
jgi:hypothetical protein